jgi:hypothetical protein
MVPDTFFSVEYEITKDDLIAFSSYHHFHSPVARRRYLWLWFLPAFLWLLVCTGIWHFADREHRTPVHTFLSLLPLFCGIPIYLGLFPWRYRCRVRNLVASMVNDGTTYCGALGRHCAAISPESITESSALGQTVTAWCAVERVVDSGDYAYVYINASAAVIVPRRAFSTRPEFDEFVRTAREVRALKVSGINTREAKYDDTRNSDS